MAESWKSKVLNLLFPPKCVFCGRLTGSGSVCSDCEKSILTDEPRKRTLPGDIVCVAPFRYDGEVRRSILRFKFEGRDHYAGAYGEIMARTAALELADEFDLVTWVPVSKKRRQERGYDQSELLARAVCRVWNVEAVSTLKKVHHNAAQSGMESAEQRRANVLGVYETADRERFAGKRLLLVDDILTTGSTVSEAARVLLLAGAEKVSVLTLAMAVEDEKKLCQLRMR